MKGSTGQLSIEQLHNSEFSFRSRLVDEPLDLDARMQLAWCLLFQAVYLSGWDSNLHDRLEYHDTSRTSKGDSAVHSLILDCSKQICTAMEFSRSSQINADVQQLQMWIDRLCVGDVLGETMREVRRSSTLLAHDVANSPDMESFGTVRLVAVKQ